MLSLVFAAAVAGTGVAPSTPRPCPTLIMKAAQPGQPPRAQKLTELPKAIPLYAVIRKVDSCQYMQEVGLDTLIPAPEGKVAPATPTAEGR